METSNIMPAGTYFIGDPCYAIDNEVWDEYLNAIDYGSNDVVDFKYKRKKLSVWANRTAYGYGVYQDQFGNSYGVDAGLIGATPIEFAKRYSKKEYQELGQIITFEKPFVVHKEGKGLICIGHIEIDTEQEEIEE